MEIIEIQKFVGLIVKNNDIISFWYPLQMLSIEILQQNPFFSCRISLHLLYVTRFVIISIWLWNCLSVDHQGLSCLMSKLISKMFKACCSFIKYFVQLFFTIYAFFKYSFATERAVLIRWRSLALVFLAVLNMERPLWSVPPVICCFSLFIPFTHSLTSRTIYLAVSSLLLEFCYWCINVSLI